MVLVHLMYLAIATRPDIAYAVGVLAQFSTNPGIAHWKAVIHLFRYLKGTLNYDIILLKETGDINSTVL